MKILFVAMPDSVHTARWISSISDPSLEVYLFSSTDSTSLHPLLRQKIIYRSYFPNVFLRPVKIGQNGSILSHKFTIHYINVFITITNKYITKIIHILNPNYRVAQLRHVVQEIQPDIIHSLEIQSGGYLVSRLKNLLGKNFPRWVVSNWGSDIYFFGKKHEHIPRIKEVMKNADLVFSESERDSRLVIQFGGSHDKSKIVPSAGGFDINSIKSVHMLPPSKRKLIMLKGYQSWSGRALTGIKAIERCIRTIKDGNYKLVLHSAEPNKEVEIAFRKLCNQNMLPMHILPLGTPHSHMLRSYARSRCAINISVTDGVPNSLTESMAMGVFPIQSNHSAADEWIHDGTTGFLISPADIKAISTAIKITLTDDKLVDKAASTNRAIIEERLNTKKIKKMVLKQYQIISAK